MNVPMSWLKSYVDVDVNTKEFMADMTLSGSKVEGVTKIAGDITNVAVGEILSVDKHPNADKLVVCKVDIGSEVIQIVTGAPNVFAGAIVPVALHGAHLAEGKVIKKGAIRGENSDGMMCSVEELGFTRADFPDAPENGIYIFPKDAKVSLGMSAVEALDLFDEVVEYEITSNRPDCFSVIGIAREAAATYNRPLKFPSLTVKATAGGQADDFVQVEIENAKLCPRYVARLVQNVKIESSPRWMRKRLSAAGVRPINNIVDITNYVMLELGQPMHAFDLDAIAKHKIIVRNAKDGESFTTLDGTSRELDSSMLVIADCDKAVAVAGVMGGENSKVTDGAHTILFESANFDGTNVRLTAKKLGLHTDASSKFEKGLDPNLALTAVDRAMRLIEELSCGEVVPGCVDNYPNKRWQWEVPYSPARVNALLGTDISAADMAKYLARLGVKTVNGEAIIPTFRSDLLLEADIAEEVGRMYGYNNIKPKLITSTPTVGRRTREQNLEDMAKNTLTALGLSEAMSYSFESPKAFDKLNIPADSPMRDAVKILNPLGEDYSVMRTTTLNGMLQSLANNFSRRNENVGLFEMCKVYLPTRPLTELPDEPMMITIGIYGKLDFFDIKGAVEALLSVLGVSGVAFAANKDLSHMHPGRTADVFVGDENVGYLGQVHPGVAANYEIETDVYVAALNFTTLLRFADTSRTYKPLPKFPGVTRDIALLVKDELPVVEIENVITRQSGAGKLLERAQLFDVYRGKQVEEGMKSVAYTLSFRAADRTLTEDEVNNVMAKVLKNLESKLGAKLRQ